MANLHSHTCTCGTTWEHDGDKLDLDKNMHLCNSPSDLKALRDAQVVAHSCPNCGKENYLKDHPILGAPPSYAIEAHRQEIATLPEPDYDRTFAELQAVRKLKAVLQAWE